MSGRLYCLAVEELQELSHVDLGNLRLHPAVGQVREARVAGHVARVACNHQAAGVPLVRGQGQLRGEALRLHQRLVVDHDELALVRPAVSLQEDPRALVAQQPQLRAAVGGRAVVGHLQLAPARPVLRQEEIVREVGGVGHGERVGGEELRRGDRARARHVAAHHAARRHSSARGRARGGRSGDPPRRWPPSLRAETPPSRGCRPPRRTPARPAVYRRHFPKRGHHGGPTRRPPRQGGRQRAGLPALHSGRVGHAAGGRHQDSKCPAGSRHRGLRRSAAC